MSNLRSLIRLSLFSSLGFGLLLFIGFIHSVPSQELLVLHRRSDNTPPGFVQVGPADPQATMKMVIGIASQNMSGLENRLNEISDPSSPDYGKHLSKTEVSAFASPNANVTKQFNSWLASAGITPTATSDAGHRVKLDITVAQANQLFNTTFNKYQDTSNGQTLIRTKAYSVPASLQGDILYVYPATSFPPPQSSNTDGPQASPSTAVSSKTTTRRSIITQCDPEQNRTLACLMAHYNIPISLGTSGEADSGGTVLMVNGPSDAVQATDLADYMTLNRPDVPLDDIQLDITSVNEADNPQTNISLLGSAPNTLTQLSFGLTPSNPMTIVTVGGLQVPTDYFSAVLDVIDSLLNQDVPPDVLLIPYAIGEGSAAPEMFDKTCQAIMELGSRGTTVIANTRPDDCALVTFFPASCPFVLSVGPSRLSSGSGSEVAGTSSAGGFSTIFSKPDYQAKAVQQYLDKAGPLSVNTTGRAYPDIAAIEQQVVPSILNGEEKFFIDDSLFSLPIVAAVIAGLNEQRRAQNKSSLGFVNPLLYANPNVFNDITQAADSGNSSCETSRFPVLAGWDPVTGLGTPDFNNMSALLV